MWLAIYIRVLLHFKMYRKLGNSPFSLSFPYIFIALPVFLLAMRSVGMEIAGQEVNTICGEGGGGGGQYCKEAHTSVYFHCSPSFSLSQSLSEETGNMVHEREIERNPRR